MSDKVERLLNLTAVLLDTPVPLAASTLAQRMREFYPAEQVAFRRTFERDKDDLRRMGVPIRVEPVPGSDPPVDGYRVLPDEYYLPGPELEPDELAALNLAATAVRLEGATPTMGLTKLGGIVRTEGGLAGQATIPAGPHLVTVFEAIARRSCLRFRYRETDRHVDPHRLHHERGRWYLIGHDRTRGEQRNFRLDRIEGTLIADAPGSATTQATSPPEGLGRSWELGDEPTVLARVRIGPAQAPLARQLAGGEAQVGTDPDGSIILELPVSRRDAFRSFVLEFLDDAEVLAPPDLRADLVEWLGAIAGRAGEREG